tara:strand:- start:387 stop:809 length:423 start_codon:yes stop_codon:yes gene_type:complete
MNKALTILALIPLTPLMYWVGVGVVAFFAAPEIEGTGIAVVAFLIYILLATLVVQKNIYYHSTIWIIAFIWNSFLLLQNEMFSKSDPLERMFHYAAVWVWLLSVCFFIVQIVTFARKKEYMLKYRIALAKFRSLGKPTKT